MPESRKRKTGKDNHQVSSDTELKPSWVDGIKPSPRWWAPVMVGLMAIGLVWIVSYHISSARIPIPGIGDWNQLIGFGIMLAGFLMTMRWR